MTDETDRDHFNRLLGARDGLVSAQCEIVNQQAGIIGPCGCYLPPARHRRKRAAALARFNELQTARARLLTPTADGADGQCCVAITAPIDGQVLRVLHESAGVVSAGEALMELGDPRHLEVVVDVLTSDAARIREGADAVIENWGGPTLSGVVRRVEPFGYTKISVLGIEEQRIDVIIDFADPHTLPSALGHEIGRAHV